MDVRERYRTDPQFNRLVSVMLTSIETTQFTPTEIREAAMLAQIMYEERHARPIYVMAEEIAQLQSRNQMALEQLQSTTSRDDFERIRGGG